MGRWLRSVLLGTTTGLGFIHAAAAADRIHIDFNGYQPVSNRYCISARSVQGDPQTGFLWRFSVGGGPSVPINPTNFVNLTNTTSTNMFPLSFTDHEKFRVYGVRPWNRTGLRGGFDRLPGVVILELRWAEIAER
jgi:hypothetical protein